jgi:hypothetical protein
MKKYLRAGAGGAIGLGLTLSLAASLTPSLAQGRGAMWCSAQATDGIETSYYYSRVFSASAADAGARASKFQGEVEATIVSAADVTAACYPAPDTAAAERALENARSRNQGESLDWPQ